ncbi:MAG: DinB family protein [Propionibacteriaceae bacterium]|nr:DinB family protein [Propionibacteriaceae bacterium]
MTERIDPPLVGEETPMIVGFLDFQRQTLAMKTAGLDADQLNRALSPSPMTLGGMLKHLATAEDWWFSQVLMGNEESPPFTGVDWEDDEDWEWHSAADDSPEELRDLWRSFVSRSQEITAAALADGGLDRLSVRSSRSGEKFSLRWILLHMIVEYARHNGHADLIRESIDGQTGE